MAQYSYRIYLAFETNTLHNSFRRHNKEVVRLGHPKKCFVSHCPLSRENGSVGRAKKKRKRKEWEKKKERKTESLAKWQDLVPTPVLHGWSHWKGKSRGVSGKAIAVRISCVNKVVWTNYYPCSKRSYRIFFRTRDGGPFIFWNSVC